MKILVIDNDSQRVSLLKSLEANGHLVQAFDTWTEAVELLDRAMVHILVLDPQTASSLELSEWRRVAGENSVPLVVGMDTGPEATDHCLPLPLREKDVAALPGLTGVPAEPEPVDTPAALEICDNDEELLREIAGIFLGDSARRLDKLAKGLVDQNWQMVIEAAHLMKGSALNLAADPLRQVTKFLERAAEAGHPAETVFWSDQSLYEYYRLENFLKGFIEGSASQR